MSFLNSLFHVMNLFFSNISRGHLPNPNLCLRMEEVSLHLPHANAFTLVVDLILPYLLKNFASVVFLVSLVLPISPFQLFNPIIKKCTLQSVHLKERSSLNSSDVFRICSILASPLQQYLSRDVYTHGLHVLVSHLHFKIFIFKHQSKILTYSKNVFIYFKFSSHRQQPETLN